MRKYKTKRKSEDYEEKKEPRRENYVMEGKENRRKE